MLKLRALPGNSRFWILTGGFVLSLLLLGIVQQTINGTQLQSIRLEQLYGFLSLGFLYVSMLTSPLYTAFPKLPYQGVIKHSRRATGVLAFYFALLHIYISLYQQLGGWAGLSFLDNRYTLSLILGACASFILLLLAVTSFDYAVKKLHFKNWKLLHRLVYAAGVLVFVHIIIIGTHFTGTSHTLSRVVFGLLLILLFLEAWRADIFIKKRFEKLGNFGVASMVVMHILFLGLGFLIGSKSTTPSLSLTHDHSLAASATSDTDYNAPDESGTTSGFQVSLNRTSFTALGLAQSSEQLVFSFSPTPPTLDGAQCFLINQSNFDYIQGFTKIITAAGTQKVSCSPLGDFDPPHAGTYWAYLRFKGTATALTARYTIVIKA